MTLPQETAARHPHGRHPLACPRCEDSGFVLVPGRGPGAQFGACPDCRPLGLFGIAVAVLRVVMRGLRLRRRA